MYKFILEFIINFYKNYYLSYNITIAFYEFKNNKLIRLSNDCSFDINKIKKSDIDELYSKFEWSDSALNNNYDSVIVLMIINPY